MIATRVGLPRLRHRLLLAILLFLPVLSAGTRAANPSSGTVSEGSTVTWKGPLKPATASANCGGPANPACDNFQLTIVPPEASFGPYEVQIDLLPENAGDWDLQVYSGASLVASSGASPGQGEVIILANPPAGVYTVAAAPFAPTVGPDGTSYTAQARLQEQRTATESPGAAPISYAIYQPPAPLGRSAAEPSCGVNWKTGKVMFISGLESLRVSFDDCSSPAKGNWEDVSFITTSNVPTLDPILFTDRITGRTFVSQLAGKASRMAFSDNDGASWLPSQGSGINSGVDHQTVGGGPYAGALRRDPNGPLYPHAVYYCSQDLAMAQCARSDDGGVTFGPAVPIYTTTECGGLHGAIKVAPDGTVYVPNKGCDGEQAVVVSEDNGLSWEVRRIPGTRAGEWDPSVAIAEDGTLYVGLGDGDGRPMVAVSYDRGKTWARTEYVAESAEADGRVGVKHTSFPVMVAGDRDRAAVAFLGSTHPAPGGAGDDPEWPGDWYLFISHTYDGGQSWTTINATPGDPVQRGTICGGGFGGCDNGTRNLLDFMDSDIDAEGRVVVAYADGCLGTCVKERPNSFTEVASIARQVNGPRMFSRFDAVAVPAAPLATATYDRDDPGIVHLAWSAPDDRGSAITGYSVYRRASDGEFTRVAALAADKRTYSDTVDPFASYFYKVTASNAVGEGPACGELAPTRQDGGAENACVLPGITATADPRGDQNDPGTPQQDIRSVSVAGQFSDSTLVFTMKVDDLTSLPPNGAWRIVWNSPNGTSYWVGMNTYNPAAGPRFDFGTFDGTFYTTQGAADGGTFTADGTIGITIAASKIGDAVAGERLTNLRGVTQLLVGALGTGGLAGIDSTDPGEYTVRSCVAGTPDARDDLAVTPENTPVVVNVLANDSDPAGEPITVTAVTNGANGTVRDNGDGTVTYTPNRLFSGLDTFSYTISDPGGLSDSATVTVTVTPFCAAEPTGRFFDTFETGAPGWQTDTVANTSGVLSPTWRVTVDPRARSLTRSFFSDATTLDLKDDRLVAPPQDLSSTSRLIFWHRFTFENTFDGGVLEVSTDGGATWRDVLDAGGSFAAGGYNGVIDTGFNSPIAGRQAWTGGSLLAPANVMTRVEVDLRALAGLDVLVRWRLAADPLLIGSLPGTGWWVDNVEFTNTLELANCPRPPVAANDAANTTRDTATTIDVLANDFDPEGGPVALDSIAQPANGTAVAGGDGTITYTPNAGFVGDDAFSYTIRDDQDLTDSASVTVTVHARANIAPEAADDAAVTERDTAVSIAVLDNDSDADGDALRVTAVTEAAGGAATTDGHLVTYTPNEGFTGTDTFAYTVTDDFGGFDTATVTVTVTEVPNADPHASDDAATTDAGTPVTIPVLDNDSDPDGDTLSVVNATQGANGGVAVNADGTITYTPRDGFAGSDTFTYTVEDGRGGSDTATVTVVVAEAPASEGRADGAGHISDKGERRHFGFNAKLDAGAATGRLSYDKSGLRLTGTITTLRISGTRADLSGVGTLRDGTSVRFTAHAIDNGHPGAGSDEFGIVISDTAGNPLHSAAGTLLDGNVNVR